MARMGRHEGCEAGRRSSQRVESRRVSLQNTMAVTLICPKCQSGTELRGMMDAWYLTWCPDCERLWRVGMWTLLDTEPRTAERPPRGRDVEG